MRPPEVPNASWSAIRTWPRWRVTRRMADLRIVKGGYRKAWLERDRTTTVRVRGNYWIRIAEPELVFPLAPGARPESPQGLDWLAAFVGGVVGTMVGLWEVIHQANGADGSS